MIYICLPLHDNNKMQIANIKKEKRSEAAKSFIITLLNI
jgi:hypothetical protein